MLTMSDLSDPELALQTIRAVAGLDGFNTLLEAKGGTEVFIPNKVGPDHWLYELFGEDKAREIIRRLTVIDADGKETVGIRVYLSRETAVEKLFRELDEKIIQMLDEGAAPRTIVATLRVTERHVRNIKKALRAPARQIETKPIENGAAPIRSDLRQSLPAPRQNDEDDDEVASRLARRVAVVAHRQSLLDRREAARVKRKAIIDTKKAIALDCFRKSLSVAQTALIADIANGTAKTWRLAFIVNGDLEASTPQNRNFTLPALPPPSDNDAGDPLNASSPDHSANVGETVVTPSDEVQP